MTRGFGGVEAAIKAAQQRSAGDGKYLPSIYWKDDGESKVLRFLPAPAEGGGVDPDGVVHTRDFYEFVTINDGTSKRDFIKPLDREDWIGKNIKAYDRQGNLVSLKARNQTVGLAVVRSETPEVVDGRRVMTYADELRQIEVDGEVKQVQQYGVVKQGNKNFWSVMMGYYQRFGTICDRDYVIERRGKGLDTTYTIIPCDPVPELDTDEKVLAAYSPPTTLAEWIKIMESDERVETLLRKPDENGNTIPEYQLLYGAKVPTGAPVAASPAPAAGGARGAAPAASSPAPQGESDEFSSLRDELMGYQGK